LAAIVVVNYTYIKLLGLKIFKAWLGLCEEAGACPGQLTHGGLGGIPRLQAQLAQDVPARQFNQWECGFSLSSQQALGASSVADPLENSTNESAAFRLAANMDLPTVHTPLEVSGVADPHHINANPDSCFHFDAVTDPAILFLIRVMRICDHWSQDPPRLHFNPLRLHCECLGRSMAPFEPPQLLNLGVYADQHPVFDFDFDEDPDPDPGFHSDADPDPQSWKHPYYMYAWRK
jgi:hypothetical protein